VIAFQAELDDWLRRSPSQSGNQGTCRTLLDVASTMQTLLQQLIASANPQTRCEGEKLLKVVNAVLSELAQLNDDSGRDYPPGSQSLETGSKISSSRDGFPAS
jgi:hypothetical protein